MKKLLLLLCVVFCSNTLFSAAAADPYADWTPEHWAAFLADTAEPLSEHDMFKNPMLPIDFAAAPESYAPASAAASAAAFVQPMPAALAAAPAAAAAGPSLDLTAEHWAAFLTDPAEPTLEPALATAAQPSAAHVLAQQLIAQQSALSEHDMFKNPMLPIDFAAVPGSYAPASATASAATFVQPMPAALAAAPAAAAAGPSLDLTAEHWAAFLAGPAEPTLEPALDTASGIIPEQTKPTSRYQQWRLQNNDTYESGLEIKKLNRRLETLNSRILKDQHNMELQNTIAQLKTKITATEKSHENLKKANEEKRKEAIKEARKMLAARTRASATLQPASTAQAAATPADDPYADIDAQLYAAVAAFTPSPIFPCAGSTPQAARSEPNPNQKRFFCPNCGIVYKYKALFLKHIASHSQPK